MKAMIHLFYLLLLFPCLGGNWKHLVSALEQTKRASILEFGLKDNQENSMDCLEVFQIHESKELLGLYHSRVDGVFSVHLAATKNLTEWTRINTLETHASQATIHQLENGSFLIALEKDAPGSCWIKLLFYPNLESLKKAKSERVIDLPRSLAPTAEGTPNVESVEIKNETILDSTISLRFHFYQNAIVDQLAQGTLSQFKTWNCKPNQSLNNQFKSLGCYGNLGDRDPFEWQGEKFYLQEAQKKINEWGSWGIYLCDRTGSPLSKIEIKTPKKAQAFANPNISKITLPDSKQPSLVLTAFIHSSGTHRSEAGQFLMVLP